MKIQIAGLSEGLHEYESRIPSEELGLDGRFRREIGVRAILDKMAHRLLLRAEVGTTGVFICDRCLAEFPLDIATRYTVFYVYEGNDPGNADPSEVEVIPAGYSVIEMSEGIRQAIELAVPPKLLCKDDCQGLCPRCGINRNTGTCQCADEFQDSRWDSLKRFLAR